VLVRPYEARIGRTVEEVADFLCKWLKMKEKKNVQDLSIEKRAT
jgi:hypothetical protein